MSLKDITINLIVSSHSNLEATNTVLRAEGFGEIPHSLLIKPEKEFSNLDLKQALKLLDAINKNLSPFDQEMYNNLVKTFFQANCVKKDTFLKIFEATKRHQEKTREAIKQEEFLKNVESFFNYLFEALYKNSFILHKEVIKEFFLPQEAKLTSKKQQEYIDRLLKYMTNNKESPRMHNIMCELLIEIIQVHALILETDPTFYSQLLMILEECIPSTLSFENRKNICYEMFNANKLAAEKLRNDPKNFPKIAGQQIFFALEQLDKKFFEKDSVQSMIDESGQTGKLIISAFMDSAGLAGTIEINTAEKMIDALKANLSPEPATQIIKEEALAAQAKFGFKESNIDKFLKKLFQEVYGKSITSSFSSGIEGSTPQIVSPVFEAMLGSQTSTTTANFNNKETMEHNL